MLSGTVLLLALLCAAPLTTIAIASWLDRENTIDGQQVSWAPVRAADSKPETVVDLALSWERSPELIAPSWSGVVTSVYVGHGDRVKSGDPLLAIDGVKRLVIQTKKPFYRELSVNDTGSDVFALNLFLESQGWPSSDTDTFNIATLQGVKKLAAEISVVGAVNSFDPSWAVFLPESSLEISSLQVSLSAPAPVPGTVIVAAGARLTKGTLVPADSIFSAATPDETSEEVDLNNLPDTVIDPSIRVRADKGDELVIGGTAIPILSRTTSMSDANLSTIAELVTNAADHVRGVIRKPVPVDALVLPAASIFANADGHLCAMFRSNGRTKGVQVEVLSETAGASTVSGNLSAEGQVMVAPRDRDVLCE